MEEAAPVNLVVVDEFVIRPLCPTPRGLIVLAGKDAHDSRDAMFSAVMLQTANGGVVSGFSRLEIMWASVRPILRGMREPGMDPRSTAFLAQPWRR